MLTLLGLCVVSLAPGLFWLWFFVRRDRLRPLPGRVVAGVFALGGLCIVPAAALEFPVRWWAPLGLSWSGGGGGELPLFDWDAALVMILVVGPVEEVCKFLVVRLAVWRWARIGAPVHALVLAAAASLGFASLENLAYVVSFGLEVLFVRTLLSTLAHLLCSSIWGYALGTSLGQRRRSPLRLLGSLVLAALVHGGYNAAFFILGPWAVLLNGGLVVAGVGWLLGRYRALELASPFWYRRNYPWVWCGCGRREFLSSRYCPDCGAQLASSLAGSGAELHCSSCGVLGLPNAEFCIGCGDQLLSR